MFRAVTAARVPDNEMACYVTAACDAMRYVARVCRLVATPFQRGQK